MQVREFDLRSLDKMLPCPFCGGTAELDTHQAYAQIANGRIGHRVVVYCADCGADQGTCVEDAPDIHPNEVIERWNKRVAMPQRELLAEALEALEPFAAEYEYWVTDIPKQLMLSDGNGTLSPADIKWGAIVRARAAADKIRAALEHQQKGEGL